MKFKNQNGEFQFSIYQKNEMTILVHGLRMVKKSIRNITLHGTHHVDIHLLAPPRRSDKHFMRKTLKRSILIK